MRILIAGFVWLLAAACQSAFALDPDRAINQFPHIWYENQLPQSTVLSIAQRSDGSIWLATYGGLVHYSGAEFEGIDQRVAPVLRSSATTALFEDRQDTLWVGTLNGGLYRTRGRSLEEVALPATVESVFGVTEDSAGALWLTTNAGIVKLDAANTQLFGRDSGFPKGIYRAIVADAEGGIWVAADGFGVAHWRDGKVEVLDTKRGLPSNAVYSLTIDRAGTLWAGTQAGLARYRDGRFEREPRAALLDSKRIFALQGDRDGNLWIAPLGVGICRLTVTRLDCDNKLSGLGPETVRSMFEDREGNLWIGTTSSGVHRLSDSKLITVTGAMDSNSIRAVYEDKAGTIWVGTDGAGVARYQDQTLLPADFNARLSNKLVRALVGDTAGNLWVGTIEGLSRVSPNGKVRNFGLSDGLPGAIVFAIAPSRDGSVWVGTTLGVARVTGESVSVIEQSRGNDTRSLYEAQDGRLWIGQRSGLHCLQNNVLDQCGTDGLPRTSVFAFHPTNDGSMWLGTSLGLMRWRANKMSRYGERAGFYGDAVFTILDDGVDHFWLSSNRGIARISLRDIDALDRGEVPTIEATWFGKNDGMLSQQGNGASQTPGWRAHDGRMWFGTANGVVIVDPARQRSNFLPPPVAIERMLVNGKDIDPAHAGKIGPGVERIEFHYAGMSYVAPAAVRYRYRLDGFDRDWVDAGDRRAAYYTNLPAGDYVFHAIACNNDGIWNNEGASASFTIVPHWYDTIWFRALLVLVTACVLIGLYRLRVWRLRKNERVLAHEVAVRTKALRAVNAELRRLASLDGLTRIANRGSFDRVLGQSWEEHREQNAPLAVLLCDIDVFKAYNDSYGHQAGDSALIGVAGALASMVRSEADLAARYGGEELALLLAHCDEVKAAAVAQRLLASVQALAIEHRASNVADCVTISIGFASFVPAAGHSPDEIIRCADEALYRAKASGRNRVCGPMTN